MWYDKDENQNKLVNNHFPHDNGLFIQYVKMPQTITQNEVMIFGYWCYDFFISTASFSVYGQCMCCENQRKITTGPSHRITQPRKWRVENKLGGESVRKLTRAEQRLFCPKLHTVQAASLQISALAGKNGVNVVNILHASSGPNQQQTVC